MTDEECIALALLHGAIFYNWAPSSGWETFTVCSEWEWDHTPSYKVEWPTKGMAARKYCERHNLLR